MQPADIAVRAILAFMGFTGLALNTVTLYVLFRTDFGSRLTTCLMRSQCMVDGYVCFIIMFSKIVGYDIHTGVVGLDIFLCYFWFKDNLFWIGCVLSVQNLAAISFDRLYAVANPVRYKKHQTTLIIGCYTYITCMGVLLAGPNPLLRRYQNGQCMVTYSFDGPEIIGFFSFHSVLWLLFAYLLPALFVVGSHGYILHRVFSSFSLNEDNGQPKAKKLGANERNLLRTTVCMGASLLIFHLYEAVKYLLSCVGVRPYGTGTVEQQVGVLLIVCTCNINPVTLVFTSRVVRMNCKLYLFCMKVEPHEVGLNKTGFSSTHLATSASR